MALNINGTTGISGVDGSASAPAVTGTDSNTGINFGTDFLAFNTGGTERARFADSGNFGINRTTPSYPLVARRTDASGVIAEFSNSSGYGLLIGQASASGEAYLRTGTGQALAFRTNGDNERMRIDSSGNIGIGTGSPSTGGNGISFQPFVANDTSRMLFNRASNSVLQTVIEFLNGGSTVGSIKHNNSSTQYNTSSDYRLKENVVSISDGITRLKTLKPYRFNFKDNKDVTVDGFLAHEVTAVPEAISGTKDEMKSIYYKNEDTIPVGKKIGDFKEYSTTEPEYQGIDQSKLVPLLTAALQEAIAKIETLETKVAALEAG